MALRQRKAKDGPILPLHSPADDNNPRPRTPAASIKITPSSKRKRIGIHGTEKNLIYRVYLPLLGFFVVAFGLAYLVVGGGRHHEHHEIHTHKHYHAHTANKILQEDVVPKVKRKEATKPLPKSNHEETLKTAVQTAPPPQKKPPHRPIRIRCPDDEESVAYLNDDYCDCLDGSDEPETSACSHVTVQKETFRCNDGTGTIFASRVHDGVKDCIDGSDED